MAFTFPKDLDQRAGAVRVTGDGNSYYVPAVIFASDGVTPISKIAPLDTKVSGRTVIDAFSGTATVTKTYTLAAGLLFANDGATDITITINGLTFTVKPTEVYEGVFRPFTSITITTTTAYRAWIME